MRENVQLFQPQIFLYLSIYLFIYFAVLELGLRAFTLSYQPYFCEGFLEIRSQELFAGTGLQLQCS
jgi:hypothetical protein